MKKLTWLFVLASLWCPALLAQEKNPVAAAIRETLPGRSKNMVAAAEEMPADKYGFKATPDQMTFGHLTLHIVEANYLFVRRSAASPRRSFLKSATPTPRTSWWSG